MSKRSSRANDKDRRAPGESSRREGAGEQRAQRSVPERMTIKSKKICDLVKNMVAMAKYYGAPLEEMRGGQLQEEVLSWHEGLVQLIASGWQPQSPSKLKIQLLLEGEPIRLRAGVAEAYSYIPTSAALQALQIERTEKGKIRRVLLAGILADGSMPTVYGWAPLSHVERPNS